jgi:hypothetical protein
MKKADLSEMEELYVDGFIAITELAKLAAISTEIELVVALTEQAAGRLGAACGISHISADRAEFIHTIAEQERRRMGNGEEYED